MRETSLSFLKVDDHEGMFCSSSSAKSGELKRYHNHSVKAMQTGIPGRPERSRWT